MSSRKRDFFTILRADMYAMGIRNTGFASMLRSFFERTDFMAVFLFRAASTSYKNGKLGRIFAFIFWRLNAILTACEIDSRAIIGEGFSLPHPAGVVIGRVTIGRNCEIYQNVTLGVRKRGVRLDDPHLTPRIGDNVNIYAGAVVIGGVRIGNNARISANTLVTDDVPEGATITGVQAQTMMEKLVPSVAPADAQEEPQRLAG